MAEDETQRNPGATRARHGGQPNESIHPANAQGRVVVNGSAEPTTPEEARRQQFVEEARRVRNDAGWFGHVDSAMRGAANTATFGLADKLDSAASALFGGGQGASFSERYRDNMLRNEAINQVDSEDRGQAQQLGEFGAEMLPYERGLRILKGGERILRRFGGRRRGKPCRQGCTRRPVSLADGAKVTHDIDFALPGPLPLELSRVYASDLEFDGPFGRNRIGALDEMILTKDDHLVYVMASGQLAEFERPGANPGASTSNALHPTMTLSAPDADHLAVRNHGLIFTFNTFRQGVLLLASLSDLHGNRADIMRDEAGLPIKLTRSDGMVLEFDHDRSGLRESVTLVAPNGESRVISRYRYDGRSNLVEASNSYRPSCRYEYDAQDRLTAYDDGIRTRNEYSYDESGRVIRVATPGGAFDHMIDYAASSRETVLRHAGSEGANRLAFDEAGRILSETDPLGHSWRYERDDLGRLIVATDPEGATTRYGYDAFGSLAFVTDQEGRRTDLQHDVDGRMERYTDPSGASWEWAYDEAGALIWHRDPLGYRTDFTHDAKGRLTGVMRHDGLIERREYDARGQLVKLVNFNGAETAFERDAFGRVIAETDALGSVTTFSFEEASGADFWTPSTVTGSDGTKIQRRDERGKARLVLVDGDGRRQVRHFGPYGLLEAIEDPRQGRIRFAYDHEERLVRVENQRGEEWLFQRDAAGRIVREVDFGGLTIDYAHDRTNRIRGMRYQDGARIDFDYDRSGLVKTVAAFGPGEEAADLTRYEHDPRGLLLVAENAAATIRLERDPIGNVTAEESGGRRIESRYDCCGDREEIRFGGAPVTAAFDPMGATTRLAIGTHAPLHFRHDKLGREILRENGAGFRLQQGWDRRDRLVHQRLDDGTTREFRWDRALAPVEIADSRWGATRYEVDEAEQILKTRFGDGVSERFSYDAALELDGVGDAAGPVPFQSARGGRVVHASGPSGERIALDYDIRGRVTARRVERDGFRPKQWRFSWDARDRLVGCVTPAGEHWRYAYDALGRRVSKQRLLNRNEAAWVRGRFPRLVPVTENDGDGGLTQAPRGIDPRDPRPPIVGTTYVWDGDVIVEEAPLRLDDSVDWDAATRWHFEPNTFRPLARETSDGTLLYIVTDHLGTPREMIDENGTIVWAAQHSTWGRLRALYAAANDNILLAGRGFPPGGSRSTRGALALSEDAAEDEVRLHCPIRFQGQWEDDETGLFYNRFRYYDPLSARYLNPDPVGLAGGFRPQSYVETPTVSVDVLGLKGVTVSPARPGQGYDYVLELQRSVYPETAGHIDDAIRAGHSDVMTPDRLKSSVNRRRRESLKNVPCCTGKDRDEWPMAMSQEGGQGASVRNIDPSDNRGAGSSIASELRRAGVQDGQRVKVRIVP